MSNTPAVLIVLATLALHSAAIAAKHDNKHACLSEKRAALEAWDAELQAILQGKPTSVLAFSRRA